MFNTPLVKNTAKIPRSIYNFSDSDSEMSYKDRGSPILLESGLKSFLGHPGHNYPLINGEGFSYTHFSAFQMKCTPFYNPAIFYIVLVRFCADFVCGKILTEY